MPDSVAFPEGFLIHAERKPFGIAWAIRARTKEEAKDLWDWCDKEWGDQPGIRRGKFRSDEE